jgi:Lycopene cyclase protein
MDVDVIILGGGISGLLLASELAATCSTIVLEQKKDVPLHKYWLTSERSADSVPTLKHCIDSTYSSLDFIAYDDTTARLVGRYCLWNTDQLVRTLLVRISSAKGTVLTGRKFYSYRHIPGGIMVRADREELSARLLVDCMGYDSPLVAAKGTATIRGFYILHGAKLRTTTPICPVGLHNLALGKHPAYLELFPTSDGDVHGVMILPARGSYSGGRPGSDFRFALERSHYSKILQLVKGDSARSLFGIIPVGRVSKRSLDNILFFGEAAQVNPAASATGLTRMLHTYREVAKFIILRLHEGRLSSSALAPPTHLNGMTGMNRAFQEVLFESILEFTSDDFRDLVIELSHVRPEIISDLIFAEYRFTPSSMLKLLGAMAGSVGLLRRNTLRTVIRYIRSYSRHLVES